MKLWLKMEKLYHFIKEMIRDYVQTGLILTTSVVLKIADELILAQNESRPPNLRKVMGHTVDSITLTAGHTSRYQENIKNV